MMAIMGGGSVEYYHLRALVMMRLLTVAMHGRQAVKDEAAKSQQPDYPISMFYIVSIFLVAMSVRMREFHLPQAADHHGALIRQMLPAAKYLLSRYKYSSRRPDATAQMPIWSIDTSRTPTPSICCTT